MDNSDSMTKDKINNKTQTLVHGQKLAVVNNNKIIPKNARTPMINQGHAYCHF